MDSNNAMEISKRLRGLSAEEMLDAINISISSSASEYGCARMEHVHRSMNIINDNNISNNSEYVKTTHPPHPCHMTNHVAPKLCVNSLVS